MRRVVVVVLVVVTAGVAYLIWDGPGRTVEHRPTPAARPSATTAPDAWVSLDAQGRCDDAVRLVTHPDRWPTECRWRQPGDQLQGQSFPPPVGPPPYDRPHVEMYVAQDQTRDQLAHAIAHEYGHMHHTRDAGFAADWLAARGLPPGTPPEVWTEDYAEVFAALFSPPSDQWRAPTPRPTPAALAALKTRFFSR